MVRGSMVPTPWNGFLRGVRSVVRNAGLPKHDLGDDPQFEPAKADWERSAAMRRNVLLILMAISTAASTTLFVGAQSINDPLVLRTAQAVMFAVLFAWVSAGFWTAAMGFYVLVRGGDPHALVKGHNSGAAIDADARTAIIMPICNEDVSTVFAGLKATCESLAATSESKQFDVFVLSDTSDPDARTAELAAWAQLKDEMGDKGQIFYRWRQRRTRRKAGNVADFCRRWGRAYRYMVVLDADSVMSGDCLVNMVRMMEANPQTGIIQTAPQACGLTTLHARSQQFASRVTGRLFTAGMQYWQLGDSHYWGHNAILRVEPFMKHCALATLPGRGGLSGEIMSHDFVEAALMRRAGYHVWLVSDLVGSYEQQPPDLLSELQRDRRWCQGNLQNARLLAEPGLMGVHRGMLATGAMAYASAPLWLLFVILGLSIRLFGDSFGQVGLPMAMAGLWAMTGSMLIVPRALGVVAVLMKGEQRFFGGVAPLLTSAVIEAALSVVQAPLRMVAHTTFVVAGLTGIKLDWKSPPRSAKATGWDIAARRFGPAAVIATIATSVVAWFDPIAALWLAPMSVPLILAIPLSVVTSRADLGEWMMKHQWLTTPEEVWAPAVLRQAWALAARTVTEPRWLDVFTDSRLALVVREAMGGRQTTRGLRGEVRLRNLERVVERPEGIGSLTSAERMRLLSEPTALARLGTPAVVENARLAMAGGQ
ncbi:MAG: glucans biosynthesis glucosyltransferase [Rhizobacter sp.]|nr:glucans biosynthesis glucosyltransferase [Rhizobacter sp.]